MVEFGQTTLAGAALKFRSWQSSTGKNRDLFRHPTLFLLRMRDVTWTTGFRNMNNKRIIKWSFILP